MPAFQKIAIALVITLCAYAGAQAQAPAGAGSSADAAPAQPAGSAVAPSPGPAPAAPASGGLSVSQPAGSAPAPGPIVPPDAGGDPLAPLSWLHGCWAGNVNQRAFTEQWTAAAGGLMMGLGHTVLNGKTVSFEFMRIEARDDGKVAYVAKPTDKAEEGFVYLGTQDDRGMTGYVFSNPARDFPSQIVYQRTPGGELFAYVKGKINGADRQVIYPFRRVDCASGKVL